MWSIFFIQLDYTSIENFGSKGHKEPPTCYVDVYADDGSDTAKILHYCVPILGVEQYCEVFINLSLHKEYVKSENLLGNHDILIL